MSLDNWRFLGSKIIKICWAFLFLALPITSFPFFPADFGGRTLVRPLSVFPLLILFLIFTLPSLFRKPLPRTLLPLFAFAVLALISSFAALFFEVESYRGVTSISRMLRNLITLGMGITFFLTVSLLPQKWEDLEFSLKWLYAGFAIALFWGTLQIIYVVHFVGRYYKLLNLIQSYISTRRLFTTRISGLTYEPKWFAEQICFLLLPWLIGSVISQRSVFRWRYKWITIEFFLLIWASLVIVFTFSRTGMLILAVLIFLGYFLFRTKVSKSEEKKKNPSRFQKNWIRLVEAAMIVLVFLGAVYFAGSQNPYFSRLWRYWTEARKRNRTYLQFIAFEQRFVYWQTAIRIFETNPLLGVGLGNYAFYFEENLPNRPWHQQVEIMRQIMPGEGRDRLITPKNLFARLIAETGLAGVAMFSIFLIAVIGCVLYLVFSPSFEQNYWGLSGILALIVFAFVVFSFDSFALPNMWIVFGLVTSAAHLPDSIGGLTETVASS